MADATPFKLVTGTPNKLQEFSSTDTVPTANLPAAALASGITAQANSTGLATDGSKLWYHTTDNELYFYDVGRSKWLSVRVIEREFYETTGGSNAFWEAASVTTSATIGRPIPYDVTVCEWHLMKEGTSGAAAIVLHDDNSNLTSISLLAGDVTKTSNALNLDVASGSLQQVQTNGTLSEDMSCVVIMRRRPS